MAKYMFLLVWVLAASAQPETCDYVVSESQEAVADEVSLLTDSDRWMMQLGQYMTQDHDINTRVFGLNFLSFSYENQIWSSDQPLITTDEVNAILSDAVESATVSVDSLILVKEICRGYQTKQTSDVVCDLSQINALLLKRNEHNMFVYFDDLRQAVENRDEQLIDAILQQMSHTAYNDMNVMVPAVAMQVARDFYMNEPPTHQVVDDFMTWFDNDQTEHVDKAAEPLLTDLTHNAVQSILKMSTFVIDPEFRPLVQACRTFQKQPDQCEDIAEILINNSSTYLGTLMGYGLMVEVRKVFAGSDMINQSEAASDAFDTYRGCVIKSIDFADLNHDWHLYLLQTFNNMGHEGLAHEQVALYLYKQRLSKDQENIKDPRQCGLRYLNSKP